MAIGVASMRDGHSLDTNFTFRFRSTPARFGTRLSRFHTWSVKTIVHTSSHLMECMPGIGRKWCLVQQFASLPEHAGSGRGRFDVTLM